MSRTRFIKNLLPFALKHRMARTRLWLRTQPVYTRRKAREIAAGGALAPAESELLSRVDSTISFRDGMYRADAGHYFGVGLSAIRCIDEALARAGAAAPRKVLDLPCGHGRVLRFLAARFPEARITGCDLDRDGVDFCARTFGIRGVYSVPALDQLELDDRFDLIWCGSLATHLEAPAVQAMFRFFARHLAPGGIVAFTTHGDYAVGRMPGGTEQYGISKAKLDAIVAAYGATGFGYADYADTSEYGISATSPAWVRRQVAEVEGMDEVYFAPRGWDEHQDVFAFQKHA
jgi:SAM-dependent methyltransferase